MAHITAIVIEVTGGSPLFHIPVPLSAIPGLSGGTARRGGDGNTQAGSSNDAPDEKFQLVFRIKDGSPTFHIGGAEVGVSAADAYNYATALRGVVKARSKAKETRDRAAGVAVEDGSGSRDIRVDETPRVRVKVEEETPRIPQRDKGKKREREKKQVEPAQAVGHEVMDVREIAVPTTSSVSPPSPTIFRREKREYTEEEQAAFARGSLTLENFAEVYAEGQHDFAVECAPSEPGDRKLSDIEDTEWRELWESLLHLDRIFSGPLRDNDGLKLRSDKMMAAAARRVHERESAAFKSGRGTSPSNPQNKPPEVRPDSRQNGVQNQHAQNGAGTRGDARHHSQTGGNAPPAGRGYVQAQNAGRVNAPAFPDPQSSLGDIEVGESPTLNVTRNRNAKNGTAGNAPVASTSRNVAGKSNAAMNPDRSVSGNSHANPTMNANQSHLHPQLDANEMNTSAIVANARLALRPLHQAMLAHGRAGSSSQESASNPASLGNTEWVLPAVGSRGSARGGLLSLSQEVKENELRAGDSASGAAATASTSTTAAGTRTASLKRAREDEHEHDIARYRERDSRNGEREREGVRNANREGEGEQDGTGAAKRPKRNKPVQQLQALGPSTPRTTRARAAKGKAAGDLAGPPVGPVVRRGILLDSEPDALSLGTWRTERRLPIVGACAPAPASAAVPAPAPRYKIKEKCIFTGDDSKPKLEYVAWIVGPEKNDASADAPAAPILNSTERAWLAKQTDLARAPDFWRPVQWFELGARMQTASLRWTGRATQLRPVYHGVLLKAWDAGEWRFAGHERVGRVGVPWAMWVRGEEGRRWRGEV